MFPRKEDLTIGFAHAAYRLQDRIALRDTGLKCFEVRTRDDLEARLKEADVLLVSGLWRNELIELAPKLRFIQSISAGVDQYSKEKLAAAGIRLASAAGVNARAVAEHAIALVLAISRRLGEARDNQAKHAWRGMIGDLSVREDELGGKTMLIVGQGRIGGRLAQIAKAFDMKVIGIRRDAGADKGAADAVHTYADLDRLIPQADYVALTCALTPETEGLIGARQLGLMKASASLINVARGKVMDEAALVETMRAGRIFGAGIDVTREEPLPGASPLWDLPNVFVTPHTGGETRAYEDNVLDILLDNLGRLWRGEAALRNQIV